MYRQSFQIRQGSLRATCLLQLSRQIVWWLVLIHSQQSFLNGFSKFVEIKFKLYLYRPISQNKLDLFNPIIPFCPESRFHRAFPYIGDSRLHLWTRQKRNHEIFHRSLLINISTKSWVTANILMEHIKYHSQRIHFCHLSPLWLSPENFCISKFSLTIQINLVFNKKSLTHHKSEFVQVEICIFKHFAYFRFKCLSVFRGSTSVLSRIKTNNLKHKKYNSLQCAF